MDLGGGSTQIAFLPSSGESLADSPIEFIRDVHVFGEVYKLYSHRYANYSKVNKVGKLRICYFPAIWATDCYQLDTPLCF